MAATMTVTGTNGPGLALTSVVYNNIASFKVDTVSEMLELIDTNGKVSNISIAAAATLTATLTAPNTYAVTIAN